MSSKFPGPARCTFVDCIKESHLTECQMARNLRYIRPKAEYLWWDQLLGKRRRTALNTVGCQTCFSTIFIRTVKSRTWQVKTQFFIRKSFVQPQVTRARGERALVRNPEMTTQLWWTGREVHPFPVLWNADWRQFAAEDWGILAQMKRKQNWNSVVFSFAVNVA